MATQQTSLFKSSRKTRRPTPILKTRDHIPDNWLDPNPPLTAARFTREFVLSKPALLHRPNLFSSALKSARWKVEGAIVFCGSYGWNEEMRIAGEHVAAVIGRYVDAYDTYSSITYRSILESPRIQTAPVRIETPPTIHPRVLLHDGIPSFKDEIRNLLFAVIGEGKHSWMSTLRAPLFNEAVLVGLHADVRAIAKAKRFKVRYLSRWLDWVAVRVVIQT